MKENLMPQLSPPVARMLNTQSASVGERAGVVPCAEVDGEDGSLVASFPSVKLLGYGGYPPRNPFWW